MGSRCESDRADRSTTLGKSRHRTRLTDCASGKRARLCEGLCHARCTAGLLSKSMSSQRPSARRRTRYHCTRTCMRQRWAGPRPSKMSAWPRACQMRASSVVSGCIPSTLTAEPPLPSALVSVESLLHGEGHRSLRVPAAAAPANKQASSTRPPSGPILNRSRATPEAGPPPSS